VQVKRYIIDYVFSHNERNEETVHHTIIIIIIIIMASCFEMNNLLKTIRAHVYIYSIRWMDADVFLSSQAKIMPPGSVYNELNRKAVLVSRSLYSNDNDNKEGGRGSNEIQGFQHRSLPFRNGFNRVYDPVE
jgi:hypothetical protein